MRLVLDANRFFSALLKDGPTRKAFYDTDAAVLASEFLKVEWSRHASDLQRRSRMSAADFERLVDEAAAQVVWVPDAAIRPRIAAARQALRNVDIDDVPYLAVKADAIWSHDLDFDRQTLVARVPPPAATIGGA